MFLDSICHPEPAEGSLLLIIYTKRRDSSTLLRMTNSTKLFLKHYLKHAILHTNIKKVVEKLSE